MQTTTKGDSGSLDESTYMALRSALAAGTSGEVTSTEADDILKYYILNEQVDNERSRKLFPQTSEDEALFYGFLQLLSSSDRGAGVDKDYCLVKMACVTRRAAEWAEALSAAIQKKWRDPSLGFIETVIDLPDTERAFILSQTIPEGRDEVDDIMGRMDDLEGIETVQGYSGKIKEALMEIASSQG